MDLEPEPTRPPVGTILRRAALRGALHGVALGLFPLGLVAMRFLKPSAVDALLRFAIALALMGSVAAPVAAVESLFAGRPPSARRDVLAALATLVAALAWLPVASLQVGYTLGMVASHDVNFGLAAVPEIAASFDQAPVFLVSLGVGLVVPFVPVAIARLRAFGLLGQLLVAIGAAAALVALGFVGFVGPFTRDEAMAAGGTIFASAFIMPVAAAGADRIERAILQRGSEPPIALAPAPTGKQWALAVTLVLVGCMATLAAIVAAIWFMPRGV